MKKLLFCFAVTSLVAFATNQGARTSVEVTTLANIDYASSVVIGSETNGKVNGGAIVLDHETLTGANKETATFKIGVLKNGALQNLATGSKLTLSLPNNAETFLKTTDDSKKLEHTFILTGPKGEIFKYAQNQTNKRSGELMVDGSAYAVPEFKVESDINAGQFEAAEYGAYRNDNTINIVLSKSY